MTSFWIISIGAMLAAAFAAITTLEMVIFGKYDITFFRQIVIIFV
jgi:hypothetical protein